MNGINVQGALFKVFTITIFDFFLIAKYINEITNKLIAKQRVIIHISKFIYDEIESKIVQEIKWIKPIINKFLSFNCSEHSIGTISFFKSLWKIIIIIKNDIIPQAIVGKAITLKYVKKSMFACVAKNIFVGFPIINIIDQVFALTNSLTK